MFQKMQEFLTTPKCRRHLLLKHFETDEDSTNASDEDNKILFRQNCCDNCTNRLKTNKTTIDEQIDVTKDALRVF